MIRVNGTMAMTLTLAAALALWPAGRAAAGEGADYEVTFTRLWTVKSHPFEYPKQGVLTGPHLSGLIGASHNGKLALFAVGAQPTPGLENLAESGKHSPLDGEIKAAIAAGNAGSLFETGPIRDATKTESTSVHVTDAYPQVSAVAMIAPSPDWFAGVAAVDLKEGDTWVATKTVELYAYDAGGDEGRTYEAPDMNDDPKKPTMALEDAHFVVAGKKPPVATLTFTKK